MVFDQAAQICQPPQDGGEQAHGMEKGEDHKGLHKAAWIFKSLRCPVCSGILASVLTAKANILAADIVPTGGRIKASTQCTRPGNHIYFIYRNAYIHICMANTYIHM